MVCVLALVQLLTFLSFSIQCCGSIGTESLICWPNNQINFCVSVALKLYGSKFQISPYFLSIIDFKWDTGSQQNHMRISMLSCIVVMSCVMSMVINYDEQILMEVVTLTFWLCFYLSTSKYKLFILKLMFFPFLLSLCPQSNTSLFDVKLFQVKPRKYFCLV